MSVDTSNEAVERLAARLRKPAPPLGFEEYDPTFDERQEAATTLCALAQERDAADRTASEARRAEAAAEAELNAACAERDAARLKLAETEHYADQIRAERDAARAEVAKLRAMAEEFVRRVEAGEVRSVRTYAAFKAALAAKEGKQ